MTAKKVPKLRFPEFNDEWGSRKIKDLGEIATGTTPRTSNKNNYGGEHLFVSPADITNNLRYVRFTNKSLSAEGFTKSRSVRTGATLFVCIGSTIGKVAQAGKQLATNQQINAVIANDNFDNDFVYSLLVRKSSKIASLAAIQAVPLISKSNFQNIKVITPGLSEQQKIADFLTAVDDKISALQTKKELLEKYKKGVMHHLFSREIRFSEDSGQSYPDWSMSKMEEVFKEIKDKVGERNIETYSITAGEGFVSQKEKFGKDISGKQNDKYTVLGPGNFSYNKGNSKTYMYGCIYPNLTDRQIAVPNVFISFKLLDSSFNSSFFAKLFEDHYLDRQLRRIISSSARMDGLLNVSKRYFFQLKIPVPHPNEQQKIADFLTSLDDKIKLMERKLQQAERFKKGLLQQMFI